MTVLVTGASGFVGRHTVQRLVDLGLDLHATSTSAAPGSIPAGIPHTPADLMSARDRRSLIDSVAPECLVHAAWNATPGQFWTTPENLDWVGTTLGLVREFAEQGGRRVVLVGSCAEYEWGGTAPLSEDAPIRPETLYGAAKAATAAVAARYARTVGCSVAHARLFFVFGADEPAGKLASSAASAFLRGEPFTLTGGSQIRDFVHVDDVAAALVAILRSDVEGPVNVGTGEGHAVAEFGRMIAESAGRPELLSSGGDSVTSPPVVADARLLRGLGWSPAASLRQRVSEVVAALGDRRS